MKIYHNIVIKERAVKSVVCDCCEQEYTDEMDLQEFLHYTDTAGYSSAFPDESFLELDLCSKCVKKLLGKYITVDGKKGNENG